MRTIQHNECVFVHNVRQNVNLLLQEGDRILPGERIILVLDKMQYNEFYQYLGVCPVAYSEEGILDLWELYEETHI